MNLQDYQKEAMQTACIPSSQNEALSLGAMGLSGEAGEVTDYLKKVIFHQHPMEIEKLKSELGDVLWYIAYIAEASGLSLQEILNANLDKLRKRYPDGWSEQRSINRRS